MREILFRGKRIDNDKWIEGCFVKGHSGITWIFRDEFSDRSAIMPAVIPETVGQYTGLTDKNGKRIFEGDVIESWLGSFFVIKFGQYSDSEEKVSGNGWHAFGDYETLYFDESWEGHEVIGNIHDNSELLKR